MSQSDSQEDQLQGHNARAISPQWYNKRDDWPYNYGSPLCSPKFSENSQKMSNQSPIIGSPTSYQNIKKREQKWQKKLRKLDQKRRERQIARLKEEQLDPRYQEEQNVKSTPKHNNEDKKPSGPKIEDWLPTFNKLILQFQSEEAPDKHQTLFSLLVLINQNHSYALIEKISQNMPRLFEVLLKDKNYCSFDERVLDIFSNFMDSMKLFKIKVHPLFLTPLVQYLQETYQDERDTLYRGLDLIKRLINFDIQYAEPLVNSKAFISKLANRLRKDITPIAIQVDQYHRIRKVLSQNEPTRQMVPPTKQYPSLYKLAFKLRSILLLIGKLVDFQPTPSYEFFQPFLTEFYLAYFESSYLNPRMIEPYFQIILKFKEHTKQNLQNHISKVVQKVVDFFCLAFQNKKNQLNVFFLSHLRILSLLFDTPPTKQELITDLDKNTLDHLIKWLLLLDQDGIQVILKFITIHPKEKQLKILKRAQSGHLLKQLVKHFKHGSRILRYRLASFFSRLFANNQPQKIVNLEEYDNIIRGFLKLLRKWKYTNWSQDLFDSLCRFLQYLKSYKVRWEDPKIVNELKNFPQDNRECWLYLNQRKKHCGKAGKVLKLYEAILNRLSL